GLAVNLYYEEAKLFPAGTIPNADLRPEQRLSWMVSILPYLKEPGRKPGRTQGAPSANDQRPARDAPAHAEGGNNALRWFLCPSAPGTGADRRPAQTSYVGIAGVGADAAELPATDPRAGVLGYDRRIGRQDIAGGLSYTMLATET